MGALVAHQTVKQLIWRRERRAIARIVRRLHFKENVPDVRNTGRLDRETAA